MTIMGKINHLGNAPLAFSANTVLFDGNNGSTNTVEIKKGIIYIRGQGGGGAGGNNIYMGNGGGGGSGAGFEGEIYIFKNIDVELSAGTAGKPNGGKGGDTIIGSLFNLGGGGGGGNDNNLPGIGGTLVVGSDCFKILNYKVKSNGLNGGPGSGDGSVGANSVLTGNGAGGDPLGNRNATKPGAGGGGGKPWSGTGGSGMYGELKIIYKKSRP